MHDEPSQKKGNTFTTDEKAMTFTVVLHLEQSAAVNLGSLEMAKDAIKNFYMQKGMKEAMKKAQTGLVVPGNGTPPEGLHVV